MKLERLNENQIRCTLTKSDFEERQLKLSELATGSVKARELFRDLFQEAALELGFETENIPLMIEAVPVSGDSLVLVVTRMEHPEDIEDNLTRIARLAEALHDLDPEDFSSDKEEALTGDPFPGPEREDDPLVSDIIGPFARAIAEARKTAEAKQAKQEETDSSTGLFIFEDLDRIIRLTSSLVPFYQGGSLLYKRRGSSLYYLLLLRKDTAQEDFDRACMLASEYGTSVPVSYAGPAYFKEHCRAMFEEDALKKLYQLNSY